mmetsp:Transcript_10653/g.19738  ORF Transcript_10653/g.19738 Transcript_10653/m.19738 type:complete len:239 (-) Transcript_10653:1827-2543(-)
MRTLLYHHSATDDTDFVTVPDSAEPVSNDEHCHPALHDHRINRLLHLALRLRVQSTCRLVQQQDSGMSNEGARNGYALLLATGKLYATLSNFCLISLRHRCNEIVSICSSCRFLHIFGGHLQCFCMTRHILGILQAIRDVLADGSRIEHRLLADDRQALVEDLVGETPHVDAVKSYLSLLRLVESLYKSNDGTLAVARRPNKSDCIACRDMQIESLQHFHFRSCRVTEMDVLQMNLAP